MAFCQPLTKEAGSGAKSGSLSQWYGSTDPDPYQNVTDPQLCLYRPTPTYLSCEKRYSHYELFFYSSCVHRKKGRPGRVWKVASRLGKGMSLNFFLQCTLPNSVRPLCRGFPSGLSTRLESALRPSNILWGIFNLFLKYFIQHCFICRPSGKSLSFFYSVGSWTPRPRVLSIVRVISARTAGSRTVQSTYCVHCPPIPLNLPSSQRRHCLFSRKPTKGKISAFVCLEWSQALHKLSAYGRYWRKNLTIYESRRLSHFSRVSRRGTSITSR